jgi:hypothetical protein
MPITSHFPVIAKLDEFEVKLLTFSRYLTEAQKDDVLQMIAFLAMQTVTEKQKKPPANVVLLADPKRKFR